MYVQYTTVTSLFLPRKLKQETGWVAGNRASFNCCCVTHLYVTALRSIAFSVYSAVFNQ
jgi:hypothetical protein